MKASLPNAFAVVRLGSILEFHLSRPGTSGPDRPYSPYVPRPEEPTKSGRCPLPLSLVLSFASILSRLCRPDFFQVTPIPSRRPPRDGRRERDPRAPGPCRPRLATGAARPAGPHVQLWAF